MTGCLNHVQQQSKCDVTAEFKYVGHEHDEYYPASAFNIPFNYIHLKISAAVRLTLSLVDPDLHKKLS